MLNAITGIPLPFTLNVGTALSLEVREIKSLLTRLGKVDSLRFMLCISSKEFSYSLLKLGSVIWIVRPLLFWYHSLLRRGRIVFHLVGSSR